MVKRRFPYRSYSCASLGFTLSYVEQTVFLQVTGVSLIRAWGYSSFMLKKQVYPQELFLYKLGFHDLKVWRRDGLPTEEALCISILEVKR